MPNDRCLRNQEPVKHATYSKQRFQDFDAIRTNTMLFLSLLHTMRLHGRWRSKRSSSQRSSEPVTASTLTGWRTGGSRQRFQ